ncbi:MAG: radical SAM protein [Chloroflexi bacterium]|nr:radical SAM protein [Chloroflexota bacterium]
MDLPHYPPAHRERLLALLATPPWQEVLTSGLLEEVRRANLAPGKPRAFIDAVVAPLLAANRPQAADLVAAGCRDGAVLLDVLARWPADLGTGREGGRPPLAFLGLNLTAACNLAPRCVYCNQPWVRSRVDLAGWKAIVAEATVPGAGVGPYIYLTGGEPLTLGEALWGDDGLVAYATARGAGVNVNTNATLITPRVALALVKAGLLRLHISLDTVDPALHDALRGRPGLSAVLEGIMNVQLARELVGVDYPGIHTNCVLTVRSLEAFPALFAFLLGFRRRTADPQHPLFNDLFPHVIPVGGSSNDALRPTAEGFRHFYEEVWPQVARRWDEEQAAMGIPQGKRRTLFGYFSNPYLRVAHRGGLEAYARSAAEGRYGTLALARHCYVAPTQAAFTPDGAQYRCGAHAIRHALPLEDGASAGLYERIAAGLPGLAALPTPEHCDGCALATLYINQEAEKRLRAEVQALLHGEESPAQPAAATVPEALDEI